MFELERIREQVLNGEEITFETFDEDLVSSDPLGSTKPIPYQSFCENQQEQTHTFDLYIKKVISGKLFVKTKFIYVATGNS